MFSMLNPLHMQSYTAFFFIPMLKQSMAGGEVYWPMLYMHLFYMHVGTTTDVCYILSYYVMGTIP